MPSGTARSERSSPCAWVTICNPPQKAKAAHDGGNDDIRPAGAGAENAHCREHHGEIAKRIIARADPDRTHIRIAGAEPVEHEGDTTVGEQGGDPDHAHDLGPWQRAGKGVPYRAAEHPQGKMNKGAAFGEGGSGAPGERHAGHAEADGVIRGIAEKIKRIGLQGGRTSGNAGNDLGQEETGIDAERDPQGRDASAGY